MMILEIDKANFEGNKKLVKMHVGFLKLVAELNKREVPKEVIEVINIEIENLNSFTGEQKKFLRKFVKSQTKIMKLLETKLGLVVKKHYQNTWMAVGLALGMSMGVAIGSFTNMTYMSLGLPIGLAIGIQLGKKKDGEILKEGKQLDIEISSMMVIS